MREARSQDTSSCNTLRLWSNRQTYHSQRHSAHLSLEARLRGAAALAAPILMRAVEPSAAAVPAGARRTRRLIWRARARARRKRRQRRAQHLLQRQLQAALADRARHYDVPARAARQRVSALTPRVARQFVRALGAQGVKSDT